MTIQAGIKRILWIVIATRSSHPDVAVEVLSGVWTGSVINMSLEALLIGVRPDVGIDILTDVPISRLANTVVGLGIDMPIVLGIIVVVTSAVIASKFVVSASYTVDVLVDVRLDALPTVYSGVKCVTASTIGADTLASVMADSEYIVPPSIADPVSCC